MVMRFFGGEEEEGAKCRGMEEDEEDDIETVRPTTSYQETV
jgi:hypothetical protein